MTPYLLIYLAVGATIMAFVILRTPYDNEPDVMVKLMARKDYSDNSNLYENILIKFLVPLSACLIIVVAWPLLLMGKVKDSWELRYVHKKEADAKAAKALIPSCVRAEKVTNEAWATAKVQKLLAKAQGESEVSDV